MKMAIFSIDDDIQKDSQATSVFPEGYFRSDTSEVRLAIARKCSITTTEHNCLAHRMPGNFDANRSCDRPEWYHETNAEY